ncbi:uncharacterized protein LOC126108834 [Schistocerca cancellata]|uniref:uncharacterized protein LOC126108834 n=1 Tax=Schistocerca cancellata TaxID=274614 RepID=UPI002119A6FB|nr:uncharacterized protein LOC126108834 [Schistocerca cancellata]
MLRLPTESRGCRDDGVEVRRDAWGRPPQPTWECESGTGLYSFVDSFSQSMQVLGSRTADDAMGIGAGDVPPDASPVGLPAVPYPVADSVGLQELQNAMGATDEEMAILQQLGGEGPIWVPSKGEASDLLSAPKVEEEEEEADIVDLDCQRRAPEVSSTGVSCGGGEGAAATAVCTGGAPVDVGGAVPDASDRHAVSAPRAAAPAAKVSAKRKRQRRTRPAKAAGSGGENLLAAYEAKEMVCPSCHRFFLGISALQQHVRLAHDGRVDPIKRRKNHCSSVCGPSECVATSALGTPADSPPRLVCPHCRELLVGRDALVAHVAEDHPSSAVPTDFATLTAPPNGSSESVGLKTHISTALGGLLDRALNNRPEKGPGSGDSATHHRRSRQTPSVPPKLNAPRSEPETEAGSSPSGRPRRVYDTELARRVWQQLSSRQPPTELELQRATASADGKFVLYPYVCFYCECRFEQQSVRNRHMVQAHKNEIITSKASQLEPDANPDDVSASEDSDHNCGIDFGASRGLPARGGAECGRPDPLPRETSPAPHGGVSAPASPYGEETVKQKAMAALRELGVWDRRRRGCRDQSVGVGGE